MWDLKRIEERPIWFLELRVCGWGFIVLEALACGTPVITFDTGGSIESIDFKTGFIVSKGDLKGLLNAIRNVKKVGKRCYVDNAAERARSLFGKELMVLKYLKVS